LPPFDKGGVPIYWGGGISIRLKVFIYPPGLAIIPLIEGGFLLSLLLLFRMECNEMKNPESFTDFS
jgi:hypothetical protein